MPEGDTIHNLAARLKSALAGKKIVRFATSRNVPRTSLVGRIVSDVTARGKYLSIHFDDGRVLTTHLRMKGSWHLYDTGERWRRAAHLARVVIAVEDQIAVCFAAPLVRLVSEAAEARELARLGPDVVAETFDDAAALANLRAVGADREIGDALLDQSAVAGIGNIYKSETLFVERIDPFARVSDLDDATLTRIITRARTLMRKNLGHARGSFYVYNRARRPCPRCHRAIARATQGRDRRSTYYCPRCQANVSV